MRECIRGQLVCQSHSHLMAKVVEGVVKRAIESVSVVVK